MSCHVFTQCKVKPLLLTFPRSFLSVMMQSFDGGSKQMLNGTIIHEVFQRAAAAKDFSLDALSKLADDALSSPQHLGDM